MANYNQALTASLEELANEAPRRITEAKKNGVKVVGYFCPHVPEEIILAGGMLPVRLAFGGDGSAAAAGEEYLKPYSCPYARCCLGYRIEGKNPYYQLIDALCVAQTCENLKLVQEYWQKYFNIPVFKLGLPHTHDAFRTRPHALEYFKREIEHLRRELGEFSGKPIRDGDVRKAISLCNRIRENLHILYEYPREDTTQIKWREVLKITQAGYLIDRSDFLSELTNIHLATTNSSTKPETDGSHPRLMISGSIIGIGDNKILDIIETAGGNIIADAVCTGSMFARKNVTIFGIMGNPIEAIAERYLYNIPCPCMTDLDKRLGRMVKIARDYRVNGVIYYSLKYCDTWRSEFQLIKDRLFDELAIPSLLIESDYSPSDVGTIRTKVEAFIELLGGLMQ